MAKQTFTTGQVLTAAQMTSLQQTAMLGGAASAKTASYTLVAADAGTAISMSNASATTITVNTGLFAAGDTVQITNLGVGVCTITAGTATVNTSASLALAQYESGTLDFISTSAAIFIKGAGAAAASGSMTLLSTTTLSSTNVSVTSISQSYTELVVYIFGVTNNTSNGIVNLTPYNGSTAYDTFTINNGTYADPAVMKGGSGGRLSDSYDASTTKDRTNANNFWKIQIPNYTSATYKGFSVFGGFYNTSGAYIGRQNFGLLNATAGIDRLDLSIGGTVMTAGTIKVYGVN